MGEWSFCRKCGWHSIGSFDRCPECDSREVNRFAHDFLMDAKGNFFPIEDGKGHPIGAVKEKERRE
jgi:hypothetical protein